MPTRPILARLSCLDGASRFFDSVMFAELSTIPERRRTRRMLNYEIRYLTSDRRVAIIYKTLLSGDRDAVLAASKPTRLNYKHYEVWRGDECVGRGVNPRLPN